MFYKRNQVEEAIGVMFGEPPGSPSPELRTRMKRLLDADRNFGRNPRSSEPEVAHYAFYSDEAPGKGAEVEFSDYEAFALLSGMRLLHHGWPQGFAVTMFRSVRPQLEKEHGRILRQDPAILFDQDAIRKNAREGDLAVDSTDPVFLLIVSDVGGSGGEPSGSVHRGVDKVFEFIRKKQAASWTFHELTTTAHKLRSKLAEIPPRKRGRAV